MPCLHNSGLRLSPAQLQAFLFAVDSDTIELDISQYNLLSVVGKCSDIDISGTFNIDGEIPDVLRNYKWTVSTKPLAQFLHILPHDELQMERQHELDSENDPEHTVEHPTVCELWLFFSTSDIHFGLNFDDYSDAGANITIPAKVERRS
jgi:hypothetical protein